MTYPTLDILGKYYFEKITATKIKKGIMHLKGNIIFSLPYIISYGRSILPLHDKMLRPKKHDIKSKYTSDNSEFLVISLSEIDDF